MGKPTPQASHKPKPYLENGNAMGGFWPSYVYLLSRSSTRPSYARTYALCVEA